MNWNVKRVEKALFLQQFTMKVLAPQMFLKGRRVRGLVIECVALLLFYYT